MSNIYLLNSYEILNQDNDLAKEFQIFRYGSNGAHHLNYGDSEITFTQKDAEKIMKNYSDQGIDLLVDYEHQSLNGVEEAKPAAGWAKLALKEDGIYALDVKWTPKAAKMLKDREYRYMSPAISSEEDDNGETCLSRMLSIALTNTPALKGIKPLMNSINSQKDNKMADNVENEVSDLQKEIEALKKEKLSMQVETEVNAAITAGRLTPANKETMLKLGATAGLDAVKMSLSVLPQAQRVVEQPKEEPKAPKYDKTELKRLTNIARAANIPLPDLLEKMKNPEAQIQSSKLFGGYGLTIDFKNVKGV